MAGQVVPSKNQTAAPHTMALQRCSHSIAFCTLPSQVASFFADSFWMASTTQGTVDLNGGERSQLTRRLRDEFEVRYSNSWQPAGAGRLFRTRFLIARDQPQRGSIVGCVGIEAALYDAVNGFVLTSAQAERLVRIQLESMDAAEQARTFELYGAGGVAALAADVLPEYTPIALLTNLAIAPVVRRGGLGRELCECCEIGCSEWALPGAAALTKPVPQLPPPACSDAFFAAYSWTHFRHHAQSRGSEHSGTSAIRAARVRARGGDDWQGGGAQAV